MTLKEKYNKEVKEKLTKEFKYKSPMAIPTISKIIINMTAGRDVSNSKSVTEVQSQLAAITGQKPYETRAHKSLASFKLREGMPMGGKVTIRGKNMWLFLDKLISIVIPRFRDFRGISPKQFDGHGNFALGIKEQIVFPEINYDKVSKLRGLDVIIVTTAKTDKEGKALLAYLGMPFKK